MKKKYHIAGIDIPIVDMDLTNEKDISDKLESLFPTDQLITLDRQRPYNGQAWTDDGTRGKQEVHGVTMRDIKDCFIRACYDAAPIKESEYPKNIYDLPWDDIDIIAVCQCMTCWIERYMGIFPNVPDSMKETE